jgi:hypothetical protein
MAAAILPVFRSIYLCERHQPCPASKVNLDGVFTSLRPTVYPFVVPEFTAFVQMAGGAGSLGFHFDIIHAATNQLVSATPARQVSFPNRIVTVLLAQRIQNCRFDRSGLYLVQMFCNNQFMGDAPVRLY